MNKFRTNFLFLFVVLLGACGGESTEPNLVVADSCSGPSTLASRMTISSEQEFLQQKNRSGAVDGACISGIKGVRTFTNLVEVSGRLDIFGEKGLRISFPKLTRVGSSIFIAEGVEADFPSLETV